MPSSVYLSFTSTQLKYTFFRIMGNRITFRNEAAQSIRVLACRDVLPKGLIPKPQDEWEGTSFEVVARGLGCILVLEVRERMSGRHTARWVVYQDMNEERPEDTMATSRATPTRGHGATGEGEWQIAGGRMKAGKQEMMERREEQERSIIRGTPSKVAVGTGRLSVPQQGLSAPKRGGMIWTQTLSASLKKLMRKDTWNRTE
jgi:hypothetical protein